MDSGNSGSISSSGDEEYDSSSRGDHHQTLLLHHPTTFLNHHHHLHTQFGSIPSHPPPLQQTSLVSSSSHHPSLFDHSPSYLHHALSHQSYPNSLLNLESRYTPNICPDVVTPIRLQGSTPPKDQFSLDPHHHQGLTPVHDDNNNNARTVFSSTSLQQDNNNNNNNAGRNSKKRTRASRRAPTTVLTTDTSNFRAMVQEFTGIPAPPFSGSSYSRRLDLRTSSSSLRSSASHHLDNTSSFYPLRPSPQQLHHHYQNQNPLLIPSSSSSSSSSSSPLLHSNIVDVLASTTTHNVTSSAATNNSAPSNNNSINYMLRHDLGLPYHQQQQNIMLGMKNHHPILGIHPSTPQSPLLHHLPAAGFSGKSSQMPISFEDLGISHGQINAPHNLAGSGHHGLVTSECMPLRNNNATSDDDGCRDEVEGGRRDHLRSLDGGYGNKYNNKVGSSVSAAAASGGDSCKLIFSASAAASGLNQEKALLENNTSANRGGEGAVDSWICSSD